ncbi:MAG: MFS transporter [Parasphingorhabdus sp.]
MTGVTQNSIGIPEIRARIDEGSLHPLQITIIFICLILNMVDGFDVVAMSVAAPALTEEWGISAVEKGYILSAALIGMTLGAILLAPLSDVYGRRKVLIWSVVTISVSMIATGMVPKSVTLMIVLRIVSGLGIGAIIASTTSVASEFAPERYRNLFVTLVIAGYPMGAMLVGPLAGIVIPGQGWQMLFIYGGLFTLASGVLVALLLPESAEFLAGRKGLQKHGLDDINQILARIGKFPIDHLPDRSVDSHPGAAKVSDLLTDSYRSVTARLWVIFFTGFLTLYFLLSWIPSLFVNNGLSQGQGIFALTIFNLAGVLGIIVIGLTTTKFRLAVPVALFFLTSGLVMLIAGWQRPVDSTALNMMIFAIGFLLQGAFTAMYAIAARIYETHIRTTGIGWSMGLGRTGAILSPILAGYLVALGSGMYGLFLIFAVPALIAGALTMTLGGDDGI